MTREEAIAILNHNVSACLHGTEWGEALEMAIQALEQEPCEDAISRQAVLDCFTATKLKKFDFILYAREEIKKLPPVNPQPKTGHWLRMSDLSEQEDDRYKCSRCGNVVHYTNQMNLYTFNSWCGRCGSDNGRHIDYDVEANYFEEPHAESR